jgi:hypothetical protein
MCSAKGDSIVCRKWLIALVLLVIAIVGGCGPGRPGNVPADSVYVVGAKVGWWERCTYDSKQNVDQCQIFNEGGEILSDEEFLPYDGGSAVKQSQLEIVSNSDLAGPQYVCLRNGRILIPKSHFDAQKRYLDWATGKSKSR